MNSDEPMVEQRVRHSGRTTEWHRYFVALFIATLMLCVLVEAQGLIRLYYTWQDDVYMGILADRVRAEGLQPYWDSAGGYAQWQGRAYFYFSFVFFIAPFLTNSALIRTIIITAVELCSVGMVGAFISLYLTRIAGMLFVVLAFCLLPHWIGQYPTSTHVVVYHVPLAFFFGSMCLYVFRLRALPAAQRHSRLFMVVSHILLFFSLFIYEVLIPPFFVILAIVTWAESRIGKARRKWRVLLRTAGSYGVVFLSWGLIYVGYRLLHPPQYPGARLAPLDPRLFVTDIWHQIVKSVPAANSFVMFPRFTNAPSLWIQYLASHVNIQGLFEGMCIAALILLAGKAEIELPAFDETCQKHRTTMVCGVSLLCAVLVPAPLSLSVKYRGWPWQNLPYLPDYYIYLACMVAATAVIAGLFRIGSKYLRTVGILVIAMSASLFTLTGTVVNARVNEIQAEDSKKWKMVDLLSKTAVLSEMPQDAIVIAPTLWQGLDPGLWFVQDFYWTNYVRLRTGRNVRITRTIGAAAKALEDHGSVYFLEHQWTPGMGNSAVLISAVSQGAVRSELRSDSVTVISDWDLSEAQLEYAPVSGGVERASVASLALRAGAFTGIFPTPGLRVGSARLVGPDVQGTELASFPVDFEEGFSTEERSGVRYWLWSDGPSGEASLAITNPWGTPVTVVFKTKLLTGPDSKKFFFDYGQSKEVITASNEQIYDHQLTLAPGKNRILIKCDGPRIRAPGDNRYLVFGLEEWTVTSQAPAGRPSDGDTRQ
ncbi:MAG TPA: hypothetical protein VKU01_00150 [Bryobacteraceae bacterium]|nr:hypothetical protein [Bryobacteraceae bacterium]